MTDIAGDPVRPIDARHAATVATLLPDGGELGALIRAHDWAATPLGPIEQWPQSLRTAVGIVLYSHFPMIVLWGPELLQIYNDAYRLILGDKHPGGLGQPTRECWPEAWSINAAIYPRVFAGESVAFTEARYPLAPHGVVEDYYLTVSYGPVRDERGEVAGVMVTVFDVTGEVRARAERDRALAEVRAERQRLYDVYMQAPAAIAVLEGPEHTFTVSNPRYRALVGGRDVVGQSMHDALPELRDQGFAKLLDRVVATGQPYLASGALVRIDRLGDGTLEDVYLDFVYQPLLDGDGRVFGVMAHAVDVTERQRAEAALAQANQELLAASEAAERARQEESELVDTLRRIGGVLTSELDVERLVQTVTDAATQLTGAQFGAFFYNVVDRQGEKLTLYTLSGAPREAFEDFGHPRPTPIFAPTFYGTHIVRSDDITADPRYGQMGPHHGMPAGHLPVRSYLAVPVISRHGEVIGGLFFGHEEPGVFTARAERLVTGIASSAAVAMDNARLYAAERRARAEAEHANKAKSDFLASMSHELRTPLNAIGGYADLVLEGIRGPVTDAQRADLERIKRSQRHLLSLINDILNFAKIEAGRVRFDCTDVSMNRALGQLESLVAPQLHEKRIGYEYRCCDERFTAHVDPERLQQILLNLLSNAVKFTPEEGSIVVECDATADAMLVRVRDSGIGIPADKLEHIFEPFVQLDRGQTPGNAGTGLGLAISRDLARAMGGDLTAESTLDAGSTFTLTLPRRRPAAVAEG